MRRLLILSAVAVLGLYAPDAVAANRRNEEDARLTEFFRKYLDEEFRHRPMDATRLGDHRFDGLLDDLSPKARAATTALTRATLAALAREIDRKKLSAAGAIDYEILQHHLQRSLWLDENTNPFETDPLVYNDYISDSIFLPLTQSTLPKEVVVRNCIARMKEIPKVIRAARENLKVAPRVYAETAVRRNRGAIRFFESGLFDLAGKTAQLPALKAAAAPVVSVLKDYQKFLEDTLLPRATGDWRLGKKKFARKLDLELDAGITAEQVLRDAEAEFTRVEREMYVIARQLWGQACPGKALPPDDQKGRRETIHKVLQHFNQEHGKAENLVKDIQGAVKQVKAFIARNDILRLPEPDRCQVIEMPEFQRGFSVAYLNQAPPLDPRARSVYAISPPPRDWDDRRKVSYLEEYNRHMLLILSVHEAYPGHYVQLEYSNRHPSLIRRVLSSGVFAEGWAVYTEQMMLDQGLGGGSLPLRLNQLKFYLRAVANAILDHRMHCSGMTDREALRFLMEDVYQSEGEAVGKVIRAKLSSCQLSTYFVGRMAFYRLRQAVQRQQGEKFQLGRYHEAVLSHGTLPVKYLPALLGVQTDRQ
jgi:uncharacterized protein (DUF885 family)